MSILKSNDSIINLILLDEDPIFSLGLKEVCKTEEFADLNVIATGKIKDTYSFLTEYKADLWVLALDFDRFNNQAKKIIASIPQFIQEFPDLKIVIIVNPQYLVADFARLSNIKGCCYKYSNINELIKTFRLCGQGETYFSQKQNFSSRKNKINTWFYRQCKSGLQVISKEIIEVNKYTKDKKSSVLDLIYWQGRKRELKMTKWLIKKALPQNSLNLPDNSNNSSISLEKSSDSKESQVDDRNIGDIILSDTSFGIYDFTLTKIKNCSQNFTGKLQETDILKKEKKQELFIIILEQWQEIIGQFRKANFNLPELIEKINNHVFIQQIYQDTINMFLDTTEEEKNLVKYESPILNNTNIDFNIYQLNNIYFFEELILYQVLEQDLLIDNQYYNYDSNTAEEIEVIILENLVISMANYLMQYILNNFYDNVEIKNKLFNVELKSSRKVAMFRNNLVWKYRREKYWLNPRNIFEDKYEMLKFSYRGIETTKITHSRHVELNQIKGIPWVVTMLIELRDSLSRGVKALGDTLGQIIVYLLTEVIGKGIGLIGKGILQGIGSRIKN